LQLKFFNDFWITIINKKNFVIFQHKNKIILLNFKSNKNVASFEQQN
jgi:hypothetical protein